MAISGGKNVSLLQANPEEVDCHKMLLPPCHIQFPGVISLLQAGGVAWAEVSSL